jgi:hypothetical protein
MRLDAQPMSCSHAAASMRSAPAPRIGARLCARAANDLALIFGAIVPVAREHRLLAVAVQRTHHGDEGGAGMWPWPVAAVTRAVRAVRGLRPDRNPLRRATDRVEAIIVGVLVVAFLAGAPLAAVAAGHAVYSVGSRTAHVQQATWRQVPAVLVATAPAAGYRQSQVTVRASWTAPDGTRHAGAILAPPGTRAGRAVMVWVDTAGRLTGHPPLRLSQVRGQVVLATVLTALAVSLILLCTGLLAHAMLGRRRLAAWDVDWQVTEPQWTKGR